MGNLRSQCSAEDRMPENAPHRMNILGIGISAIDMNEATRQAEMFLRLNRQGYICVSDVHSVVEGTRDPALRQILNRSLMTTPDGMPLVWIGRLQGRNMNRVYGPDFMIEMCRSSVARGYTHFFY